ncbi:hypothetical protein [Chlorogloea sp. CCALA 695]|uniref:hypothetical protein n=1 Tax=Chlorogloea sp. CCALA 695 TaxID=2107693 RepID=UPI000D08254C|nr:hypothetical protein [Chlorogloea sp. CCALA 695]PSB31375.1 hypothetical protein C7B70_13675 [Chlorogloea sp. CCALA 695]
MLPRIKFLGNKLTDLCCLVGIPYSGTKPEKISRLLTQTDVQRRCRGFGLKQGDWSTVEQIQAFANTYKGKELKEMCRTVGCYAPSTKYAMAASLISWRFGCLRRGQDCYRRAKEAARNDPVRQLVLKF